MNNYFQNNMIVITFQNKYYDCLYITNYFFIIKMSHIINDVEDD